jgi:hypothetical protein
LSAVKVGEVATPEALVCTVATVPLPAKVPLAPVAGAVNVTLTPEIGLLFASVTVATNALRKAWPTCALWPPPDVAVIVAGEPAVFVKLNEAEPDSPFTDALTV